MLRATFEPERPGNVGVLADPGGVVVAGGEGRRVLRVAARTAVATGASR